MVTGIGESGPIIGYAYILLRSAIAAYLILQGWKALGRGDGTPILLVAAALVDIVSGQFGQPSIQGFAVFMSGLALACSNQSGMESAPKASRSLDERIVSEMARTVRAERPKRRIRGRSLIAEAIIDTPGQRIGSNADSGLQDGVTRDAAPERE